MMETNSFDDEVALCTIRCAIQRWVSKSGSERCHYYPDLFREIAGIVGFDVKQTPDMPREEFEAGCRKYTDELYGNINVAEELADIQHTINLFRERIERLEARDHYVQNYIADNLNRPVAGPARIGP